MRILFTGLGSIGRRHIKNLAEELRRQNLSFEIDALRATESELPGETAALLARQYRSFEELEGEYDIAYITNPTSLHAETIRALSPIARAMFIEKPLWTEAEGDISSLGLRADGVYYVACPLRHSPVIQRACELASASRVFAARALSSSYLPDWRPQTDHRKCYSARRGMGGGVELDLVHEWDYLSFIFGFPLEIKAEAGRFSEVTVDSDDLALYIARYSDMLLSLQLDYFGRKPRRQLEIYTEDETYVCDIVGAKIHRLRDDTTESFIDFDIYKNETAYFVALARGIIRENMNGVENAARVVKLACAPLEPERE
ncbi:MAG: Gfo/Idh/MocA family oxidoreductase [Oscillospiraceae bacterium]|nr:Gfo/Idh/MocA family oxidoreductase [Oscillospiraceae bacterium]